MIEALLDAARRGVRVRLILDPSEDATTLTPTGLPNQPLASELVARSSGAVKVRWYRTHGERFHSALALVYGGERLWLMVGSANFTRRSLDDYNLEAEPGDDAERAMRRWRSRRATTSTRCGATARRSASSTPPTSPRSPIRRQADYWLCRLLEGAGAAPF